MDNTGFSVYQEEKRMINKRKWAMYYVMLAVCVCVIVGLVGALNPGSANAPIAFNPAMKVNGLLFEEGFSNNERGWIKDADSEAYYDNSELHLVCSTHDGSKPLWTDQPSTFGNIAFQVKATKIDGPDQQYGVIIGQPDGDFVLYGVTNSGYYGLMKWTGMEWVPLIDYTYSEDIKQGGHNTLTIICKEVEQGYARQYIELHVNGEYLQTVVMDSDINNKIGFYVGAEGMHVSFDDFRIYSVE